MCCDSHVTFTASTVELRDKYLCDNCGCLPRERALMFCLERLVPNWRELRIHESSPVDRGASLKLRTQGAGYVATQYVPTIDSGAMHRGFRIEDLEALTFENESFDLHVTQDVLEHVFDPDAVFREIARTLRPSGAHVFTTPLVNGLEPSEACARLNEEGKIVYLREPEYHGNPMSEDGSLVTTRWGYDICERIFAASGLFTTIWHVDAIEFGIRAELNDVLVTLKPH